MVKTTKLLCWVDAYLNKTIVIPLKLYNRKDPILEVQVFTNGEKTAVLFPDEFLTSDRSPTIKIPVKRSGTQVDIIIINEFKFLNPRNMTVMIKSLLQKPTLVTASSTPDGMTASSTPDGMTPSSTPDGMTPSSTPDGMTASSTPDGMTASSTLDGMTASSTPDGMTASSTPAKDKNPKEPPKGMHNEIIILLVVVILACLAIFVFCVIRYFKKKYSIHEKYLQMMEMQKMPAEQGAGFP